MLNIKEITPEIYHLKFAESKEMLLTFIRFSDYSESSNEKLFRKKFTLQEALDVYYNDRGISYFDAVDGFNLPTSMVFKVAKEYGSTLSIREEFIISLVNMIRARPDANIKYIIASAGAESDPDAILHELCHAFYYTDEAYKFAMDTITKNLPKRVRDELFAYLKAEQYHNSVHNDETQAYMATGFDTEIKGNLSLLNMFRSKYSDVFLEYLNLKGIV